MKNAFSTLGLSLLLSVSGHAKDDVNNGGGVAEKNVVLAYERTEHFIDLCLNSQTCKVSESERALLIQIQKGMPLEKQTKGQVQFLSEKAKPGFFTIDGQVKIAKTGDRPGTPIFFNTDLLYLKNAAGQVEPISLSEALAHVIHELGHHHGQAAHNELDLLGVKVSLVLQQYIQTTPLLPHTNEITAVVINDRTFRGFPEILLYVFGDVINVSREFENTVKCSKITVPISSDRVSDVKIGTAKPFAATFHNIYWKDHKLSDDKGEFAIKGNLSNFCKKDSQFNFNDNSYKATIEFKVRRSKENRGRWKFDSDSLEIKQKYEPWWKIIQLPSI